MPLTEEDSAVESRGSENRRSAPAEMCRTSALGKKEARAGENGKVGRHIFGLYVQEGSANGSWKMFREGK